ncbi:MAG TPA: uroporphyrinogen decarboxylase family protein [Verrucomicrobiota bacterium]|nr:uroporphyrinogen decarboxylase family protein [Verrucomicrobiota bacterium]HNU49802.1 uroporphyrinogen decarboxylase family protein [Verrucomicrobiota bacterium]
MNASALTSRQVVARALEGRETPRVPTGPLAVHFCAGVAGCTLRQYTADARVLADSIIRYYERFRPDAVWLSADTWVSAEAMGATVGATNDDQPWGGVGGPWVRTLADVDRIPPPDATTQGRYPLMLEAFRRIRAALGGTVFLVACFDQYPFSLASALTGLDRALLLSRDDPRFLEALMERCLEYGLAYGRALGAAGADLLSGGDSPAGLLGPRGYLDLALPYERRLIAALKLATRKPVSLHICGDTRPILAAMATSGADVLEIDHAVDLAEACRIVGPDIALWGNLDPVGVLFEGSVAQVRQARRKAVAAVEACGHRRFVLSTGCTLSPATPAENLEALLQEGPPHEPDARPVSF